MRYPRINAGTFVADEVATALRAISAHQALRGLVVNDAWILTSTSYAAPVIITISVCFALLLLFEERSVFFEESLFEQRRVRACASDAPLSASAITV